MFHRPIYAPGNGEMWCATLGTLCTRCTYRSNTWEQEFTWWDASQCGMDVRTANPSQAPNDERPPVRPHARQG